MPRAKSLARNIPNTFGRSPLTTRPMSPSATLTTHEPRLEPPAIQPARWFSFFDPAIQNL